jgi:signal peptidase I
LPGEKIEIVAGRLLVNDVALSPPVAIGPYTVPSYGPQTASQGHPIRLGADEYFLLGDNSPQAYDSRCWADAAPGHQLGAVPRASIVGRVTAICFPLKRMHQFQ